MSAPPAARRALALFDGASRGDRLHTRIRWWSAPLRAIERVLPVEGRVLEIGCGHGLLSLYLALAAPRQVIGVDIDEHKIEVARAAAARMRPGEASVSFATVVPGELPAGPFDVIVVADVLYLLDPAARHQLLMAATAPGMLALDGVVVLKETDVAPRWKSVVNNAQEHLSTRVLRITQGSGVDIADPREFVAQLEALGLDAGLRRIDRGYPHPHVLVTARRRLPVSAPD